MIKRWVIGLVDIYQGLSDITYMGLHRREKK